MCEKICENMPKWFWIFNCMQIINRLLGTMKSWSKNIFWLFLLFQLIHWSCVYFVNLTHACCFNSHQPIIKCLIKECKLCYDYDHIMMDRIVCPMNVYLVIWMLWNIWLKIVTWKLDVLIMPVWIVFLLLRRKIIIQKPYCIWLYYLDAIWLLLKKSSIGRFY